MMNVFQTKLQLYEVSKEFRYYFVNIDYWLVLFVVTEFFDEFEPVVIDAWVI